MFERGFAARERAYPFYVFSQEENAEYIDQIVAEEPSVRWWAEQALYAERKRFSQRSELDTLIEAKIEAEGNSSIIQLALQ